jgi:non-ribosomal peptide synthetase component F
LINTKNIDAFIESFHDLGIGMSHTDNVLQMFDLTFDVSVAMLLIPLLSGACFFSVPSGNVKFIQAFKQIIDYKLTVICIVPSMLAYFKNYFNQLSLEHVRCCILTAEASTIDLVADWARCIPNAVIWNLYGPTEATIWSIAYNFPNSPQKILSYNSMIPIGKPMKNVKVLIIGADGHEICSKNVKGEIHLSGPQLSAGYHNLPDLTSSSFTRINKICTETFYKTGDLAYIDNNGDIQYCGRVDHQVQIQGFRVELSEIEHHSREFSESRNVLAISILNQYGIRTIYLFIEKPVQTTEKMLECLGIKLPYYMMPAKILTVDEFPMNSSSKIDRKRLEQYAEEH